MHIQEHSKTYPKSNVGWYGPPIREREREIKGRMRRFRRRGLQGVTGRGSIPGKVGFWVGLRMFLYVHTPPKLTNAITKTQLLGPKKGGFSPKIPRMWPFFVFGLF